MNYDIQHVYLEQYHSDKNFLVTPINDIFGFPGAYYISGSGVPNRGAAHLLIIWETDYDNKIAFIMKYGPQLIYFDKTTSHIGPDT